MMNRWATEPQNTHPLVFTPAGGTLAGAVDALFQWQSDWWPRSSLPTEHILSAVAFEALLFARRRRVTAAVADAEFNALPVNHPAGAVALPRLLNRLRHFENQVDPGS